MTTPEIELPPEAWTDLLPNAPFGCSFGQVPRPQCPVVGPRYRLRHDLGQAVLGLMLDIDRSTIAAAIAPHPRRR
ncbi:hypothetical protein [Streptomyces sp. NPDC046939]|uniref:hypothetical protein n=1 Tax=Streptomyces sp. NPDC046939 TaxID=3155376 RepID=UPI0033DF3DA0